ncbi:kynureninase [Roseitranquillus sediminis]|uniref:kynureninase n=1 Tax=Roseitranquillus sediminis TaxID=2809051 RepID=UPI001D0C134F|nr:kynureninase [Roseitranquillus sediminis]MBM9595356.1 kynureninase [Roseitranquillus sediminis]
MTDFDRTRTFFHLPDGLVYLDGNSLGPLPVAVPKRLERMLRSQWGEMAIGGWNRAGWIDAPRRVGDRIGRLIGAEPGHVVAGETLSIKVFQALAAALHLRPDRCVILSDRGNFPSDLYMADGLARLTERHEIRVVDPEDVEAAIGPDVAVLLLTEVDYRTGRLHDMARLTRAAHAAGALTVWDLAHSAGALPVDVVAAGADFAVGCTYKYLNGGPGAPAFVYVAPRHVDRVEPSLAGWLGHAAPFRFEARYRPGAGIDRMRVGTPPILQLAALDAALDCWDDVDMADVRRASLSLQKTFITEVEASCPELSLASPRESARRGSQVSFRHPEGYAIMQALIARGVVGDFRAPDLLRFGFAPLYIGDADVRRAAQVLAEVMHGRLWDHDAYRAVAAVT